MRNFKNIFIVVVAVVLFVSCSNSNGKFTTKEKEQDIIKNNIETFVDNEFFKRNYDFDLLELEIFEDSTMLVHSIIRMHGKERIFINIMTLNDEEGLYVKSPENDIRLDSLLDNDEKTIKLQRLQKNYNSEQIGKSVIVFLKGKYKDKKGVEYNYIRERAAFIIDDKSKAIYSGDLGFYKN